MHKLLVESRSKAEIFWNSEWRISHFDLPHLPLQPKLKSLIIDIV